jgi:hypothetical protein
MEELEMAILTRAHQELFRRSPDEVFPSLEALVDYVRRQKEQSTERWERPQDVEITSDLTLAIGDSSDYRLNDWSFTQVCRLAHVAKETVNRVSAKTASHVLRETLPHEEKPAQFLTTGDGVRSVHGVAYTRLWNADLLATLQEFATDFCPLQEAITGGTGLYCGEQDLFVFLIDPTGWTEIDGEAFAPGFFCWNSEVGRRSLGIQSFWFQKICQNHLVWDAVEVVEFKRKHTANVHDGLDEIRRIIENLVQQRDVRRDGFFRVIRKAMAEKLGRDADEAIKVLIQEGIPAGLAKDALEIAKQRGALTIFAVVDALTRLNHKLQFAGDRAAMDQKAAAILALAA